MNRLDQLIITQATEVGWREGCAIYLGDDPTGSLLAYFLDVAERVTLLSDSHAHIQAGIDYAVAHNQREKVCARGVDGPLDLDEFFQNQAPGQAENSVLVTRLPKSRAHLDYLAHCAARAGIAAFVGAHNTKHMTPAQNEILARYFHQVYASRGSGKFRALCASEPLSNLPEPQPQQRGHLYAIGATFAGAQPDRGGQLLVTTAVADCVNPPHTVLDFGCGNGAVSYAVGEQWPDAKIIATDISADAVISTRLTLAPFPDRVTVTWDTSASAIGDDDADVVLLNPPFHDGFAIDETLVDELLTAAARVLAPGGVIYVVYNSHLRYRPRIARLFEGVQQVARDSHFTVVWGRKPWHEAQAVALEPTALAGKKGSLGTSSSACFANRA